MDATCHAGTDCCSGHCSSLGFCNKGYPVVCHSDADCPYSTTCLSCINECVYPPNGPCAQVAPCPCGYTCLNDVCASAAVDAGQSCATSFDCPAGENCNLHTSQCQYPMCLNEAGAPLTDAGPLTGSVYCTPEAPASGCANGFQCLTNASNISICLKPCATNANCDPGEVCAPSGYSVGQVCNYDCSTTCATDADCQSGQRCVDGDCEFQGC